MASERIEAVGATFSFRTISGEVIGTDQRSDSYTTGSSRTVVYEGSGGGSGHVETEVVVNRDIWFRDGAGQEHHVRIQSDVPVRAGQHVAMVYLKAERPASRTAVSDLVTVYVMSTDRYWTIRSLEATARALAEPTMSTGAALGYLLMWLIAIGLCVVFAVGVPLVIALFIMGRRQEKRKKALSAELAKALEASHLDAIRATYRAFQAEQKRLAVVEAGKPRSIGAAP